MPRTPAEHTPDNTKRERFRSVVGLIAFAVFLVATPILLVIAADEVRQLAGALESLSPGSGNVPTLDTPRIESPGVAIANWYESIPPGADTTAATVDNDTTAVHRDTRETSPTGRDASLVR